MLPWNDLPLLEALLKREAAQTAAVIMEPINYNGGCIRPVDGYLEGVRELTRQHGVLLIFDEILSGFRTGTGGAQEYFGVTPDLSTLGKALGGGMPLAALVGLQEVMEALAPVGDVMDQGTYYGHPLVMQVAAAFLEVARDPKQWVVQQRLEQCLYGGLDEIFKRYKAGRVEALGNRFSILFGIYEPVREWR
ncbi:MAG: aminotransferase class III-fold pyridoxal phosphate-dependent enzyme [Lentisphaeria bacterium]|nr:aminotransferase class III-fold pyridoxal phosphate-dependent enzyme [Lentisphaeria bacterium]